MYRRFMEKVNSGRFRELYREGVWVWHYICRYKGAVAVHILLGILGILMMLGSSVASKFLIDAVISYDSGIIGTAAVLMLGMRLGSIAMKSISGRIAARINIRIQNELQSELFGRILRTDWQSLERFRSGDLLNRISSDSGTVAGGVTGFVPSLISGGVQFVGAFFIILYYDPVMALIALIGVPLTGISSAFLVHRMRTHNRQMKEAQADVLSFQQESFQNITTIKAFGITGRYHDRMQEEQRKYAEKYPELCQQTDDDGQGGLRFEIDKSRISIRLTAPYSDDRRKAASELAKKRGIHTK